MRDHPIRFLLLLGAQVDANPAASLHAAARPRTPSEKLADDVGTPRTACGRRTNDRWESTSRRVARLMAQREAVSVCAVCFPRGFE